MIKKKIALVCFFEVFPINNGASEVIISLFQSLRNKNKKIFYIKNSKILNLINKINYWTGGIALLLYKVYYILNLLIKLKSFFSDDLKPTIILEGASWVGYSFIFIISIKYLFKDSIVIYHSHNIDYEIRKKKNSLIVLSISKFLEKKVFQIADYKTAVCKLDQKKIFSLYNQKTYLLENGISKKRIQVIKKTTYPKKFILFSGTYEYFSNKKAIDKIVYEIMPNLLKKYPNLKLIITGKGLTSNIEKKNFVIYYNYLEKPKLLYLLKKCTLVLLPFDESPGTKIKIMEALMLGCKVITTKISISKIFEKHESSNPLIYYGKKQMYKFIFDTIKKNESNNKNKRYLKLFDMRNILDRFRKKTKLNDVL